jgi:hypothetical protein
VVKDSLGKPVAVVVKRKAKGSGPGTGLFTTEALAVIPRAWSGRGVLGCHFVPV